MEKSAFEQKALTWHEKALAVAVHCGASHEEAEDVAQDVMLRLWQMRQELDRYQSVDALAALMARHLVSNNFRRQQAATLNEDMAVALGVTPHDELETKENEAWLAQRLKQLPTTQRTLLYMRQAERRSHEEIAHLLGIGTASVSTLLARARRTLLEEIKRRNK